MHVISTSLDADPREALETSVQGAYSPIQYDNAFQRHVHRSTYPARERIAKALQDQIDAEPFERVQVESSPAQRLLGRIRECCRAPQVVQHEVTGEVHVSESRCRSRVCPRCGNVRTRQLRMKLESLVSHIDSPRMLTLTLASSDAPLVDQLRRLSDCFRKLRRRSEWKKRIVGGLHVVEITWNHAKHQWHPHIHALIDGEYWKQSDIADQWQQVTGDSRIVDIRMVYGRSAAINYVVKYVAKSQLSDKIPAARIVEWAENTHGARMVGTFGSLHGIKVESDDDQVEGGYEVIAPVEPLIEDSQRGNKIAQDIIDDMRIIRRRKLPDGTPLDDQEYQRRCSEVADRVRAWWASKQGISSGRPPPQDTADRQRSDHAQRTERLWKECDSPGDRESITPGELGN